MALEVAPLALGQIFPLIGGELAEPQELHRAGPVVTKWDARRLASAIWRRVRVLAAVAAAVAHDLDDDDRGLVVGLGRCSGGLGDVGARRGVGREPGAHVRRRREREPGHRAGRRNVEGVEHLQRCDRDVLATQAGGARIDRAVRRNEHHVALLSFLPRESGHRGDAGTGDEALWVDVAIAVHVADLADRRVRGIGLRARARADVAVRAKQFNVAALLGHDAALVEQDRAIGVGTDAAASERQDALLVGLERVARGVADGDAAAGADDVDVAALLRLQHRRRNIEVAGRDQHRGPVSAAAGHVVGIARAGGEQGRDHGIGPAILVGVRARRVLGVLSHLGDEVEKSAVDQELLPHRRQALECGPGLVARLAERGSDIREQIDAASAGVRRIDILCDRRRIVHAGLDPEQHVDLGALGRQVGLDSQADCKRAADAAAVADGGHAAERPQVMPSLQQEGARAIQRIHAADDVVAGDDAGDAARIVVLGNEVQRILGRAAGGRGGGDPVCRGSSDDIVPGLDHGRLDQ